jgi:ketosteroid isomerase-like protein
MRTLQELRRRIDEAERAFADFTAWAREHDAEAYAEAAEQDFVLVVLAGDDLDRAIEGYREAVERGVKSEDEKPEDAEDDKPDDADREDDNAAPAKAAGAHLLYA